MSNHWTADEARDFREFCRSIDLRELTCARFRRLVRLAHTEGLLSEILHEGHSPALAPGRQQVPTRQVAQ
jgi:hypothetical protein